MNENDDDMESPHSSNPQDQQDVTTTPSLSMANRQEPDGMTRSQAFKLYSSHCLSTWNIRTYEFAAIIFTAAAYPDTLLAASLRGMVKTGSSILFSSSVGRWVDQSPNRLKTLLTTISMNRISVIGASILWALIFNYDFLLGGILRPHVLGIPTASIFKAATFGLILMFGILEGLSAAGNMLSMERDWVIAVADSEGKPYDLTHLNSSMRRIDLVCKLIAPIIISLVVSSTNVKIGVLVVGTMSVLSWGIEIWCARTVWTRNSKLKTPKFANNEQETANSLRTESSPMSLRNKITHSLWKYTRDFQSYFSSNVWVPSLALALLHLSALTYSATFITYLLSVGFSLDLITIARAAGSLVEISSTIVTPLGVTYLGKAANHGRNREEQTANDESTLALLEEGTPDMEGRARTGLERLGLWGISWQLLNLVPVVYALWSLSPSSLSSSLQPLLSRIIRPLTSQPLLTFTLFFFLSISRLGLWVYDLTTQQLTQTMSLPSKRSSFTGVEYSFVSFFELGHYIMTIVLHRPEQFKWIALLSWIAVMISTVAYAGWVWKVRGHLVHWERIGKTCDCAKFRS